jgi:hypothetical protein
VSESVVFTRKRNRRGKPIGRPIFQGFTFTFSTTMASSAANPADYQITASLTKRVKRKTVTIQQPVGFNVSYNAVTNSVSLLMNGQPFKKGGHVTVIASPPGGIASAAGVFLDGGNQGVGGDNAVFTILPNARGITHT